MPYIKKLPEPLPSLLIDHGKITLIDPTQRANSIRVIRHTQAPVFINAGRDI